jgi:hypothetical protein
MAYARCGAIETQLAMAAAVMAAAAWRRGAGGGGWRGVTGGINQSITAIAVAKIMAAAWRLKRIAYRNWRIGKLASAAAQLSLEAYRRRKCSAWYRRQPHQRKASAMAWRIVENGIAAARLAAA